MGKKGRRRKKSRQQGIKAGDSVSADLSVRTSSRKASEKSAEKGADKGRLVVTHSTYLPGLIPLLKKLACTPNIQTITPAVISRVKSNAPKLRLKVSVPITGGHKLIARHRKSAQEVFMITTLSKSDVERAIAQLLV